MRISEAATAEGGQSVRCGKESSIRSSCCKATTTRPTTTCSTSALPDPAVGEPPATGTTSIKSAMF